jgi:hypothetical protein
MESAEPGNPRFGAQVKRPAADAVVFRGSQVRPDNLLDSLAAYPNVIPEVATDLRRCPEIVE